MAEEENNKEAVNEKTELDILKDKYLRALADFDNYKKRQAVEQENFVQFANENIIRELLPILDNFSRAIVSSKSHKDALIKGIALVKKQLEDTLSKFGVKEIQSMGLLFDPNIHEAILQKESDQPENTIIEETQKGYLLNGRVIRPAMVIVSKGGKSNG
ncbi:nucleotide exchange factor GrpE [Candidatus Saganbacteria bacterium]|nr:nucleotide exchange factor GrpE [Candidatus Saganbacteria bacterium]